MIHEKVINQPTIETQNFILRPLRMSDVGLLEMHAGDKRVAMNTTTIPHPLPPGSSDAFVQRAMAEDRTEDIWALDGSASGSAELLGVIGLARLDRNQSEIGYWVAPAFWKTGLASLAVGALLEANPQSCETIFASVFQDNPVSARVLTNNGFEYLGDAESYSVARGSNVDTWTYLRKLG